MLHPESRIRRERIRAAVAAGEAMKAVALRNGVTSGYVSQLCKDIKHVHGNTGLRRAGAKVPAGAWDKVAWGSSSDAAIALQLGVSRQQVNYKRRELNKPKPPSLFERFAAWADGRDLRYLSPEQITTDCSPLVIKPSSVYAFCKRLGIVREPRKSLPVEMLVTKVGECWEYDHKMLRGDYPYRTAYKECVGPIPSGHGVCRTCFNLKCINPAHLVAVDQTGWAAYRPMVCRRVSKTEHEIITVRRGRGEKLKIIADDLNLSIVTVFRHSRKTLTKEQLCGQS